MNSFAKHYGCFAKNCGACEVLWGFLQRPIPSHTNASRLYYGYAAYDPMRVHQLLTIFKAYTNYIKADSKGETPAKRFGLAKGPVKVEEILYWRSKRWR